MATTESRQSPFTIKPPPDLCFPASECGIMTASCGIPNGSQKWGGSISGKRSSTCRFALPRRLHSFSSCSTSCPPPPGCWGNQGKGCYFCCSCQWPRLNIQVKNSTLFPKVIFFLSLPLDSSHWSAGCNLIWPANSTVMSHTVSGNSGGEVTGGHYLSILLLNMAKRFRKGSG